MRIRALVYLAVLFVMSLSLIGPAIVRADGVVIVDPPECDPACYVGDQLNVTSHKVDVTIVDQIATTRIDQVFHNPNDWVAEGTYLFPLPDGATVDQFVMIVD